ncbi:MAG: polyketide cyclase, partial [Chitinophagaceae bacterium]
MEPSAKITVSGIPVTPGHLYEWTGKETGQGQMKIVTLSDNRSVDIELKFIKPFENLATTTFTLSEVAGGTNAIWSMSGESANIMDRWMFLMMDNMIGKDFENGLANLKEKSESK